MLAKALVVGAAVWVAAIIAAPIAVRSGRTPAQVCAVATYAVGSLVCHQIPARSFHLAGRPLAVCGRCTGLYVSALLGGLAALIAHAKAHAHERVLLLIAALPTAASWGLEHAGLVAQSNAIRAAAALPLGFAAAFIVVGMLDRASRAQG